MNQFEPQLLFFFLPSSDAFSTVINHMPKKKCIWNYQKSCGHIVKVTNEVNGEDCIRLCFEIEYYQPNQRKKASLDIWWLMAMMYTRTLYITIYTCYHLGKDTWRGLISPNFTRSFNMRFVLIIFDTTKTQFGDSFNLPFENPLWLHYKLLYIRL